MLPIGGVKLPMPAGAAWVVFAINREDQEARLSAG